MQGDPVIIGANGVSFALVAALRHGIARCDLKKSAYEGEQSYHDRIFMLGVRRMQRNRAVALAHILREAFD
jgi:hypothetical protein